MAATTSLLGLVTPTQGTLSGTWGDTVNYGISDYVDIAVSGTLTLTNDGAVTLANTTGSSSGNSITSSLTGAGTVTAQFAIVKVTGTLTTAKVVTGPSYSKTYTVVNSATGSTVTFKASGQTGVSIAVGETAFVYFNGTDYVKVSGTVAVASFQTSLGGLTPSTATTGVVTLAGTLNTTSGGTGLTSFTAGDVPYYASGSVLSKLAIGTAGQFLTSTGTAPQWSTLSGVAVTTFSAGTTGFTPSSATSGAVTLAGTLATTNGGTGLTSFTSGGVVYASSSSALATGSALTFDGTTPTSSNATGSPNFIFNSSANTPYIRFDQSGSAKLTIGASAIVASGAGYDFYGTAGIGFTFFTNAARRLDITSAGDVGIGTSSPSAKLSILNTNATYSLSQNIFNASAGNLWIGQAPAATYLSVDNFAMAFCTSSDGGVAGTSVPTNERMRITSAGNVGIGTSSPAYRLDLYSTTNFAGRWANATRGGYLYLDSGGPGIFNTAAYGGEGMYFHAGSNYIQFITNSNERVRIDSSGNLLVGTTSSTGNNGVLQIKRTDAGACLYIETNSPSGTQNIVDIVNASNTAMGQMMRFWVNGYGVTQVGSISTTTTTTAYNTSSDYRLKNTISPMTGALAKVAQLKPVTYKWNADGSDGEGFIAHELAEVCPSAVTGEKDAVDENGKIKPQGIDVSFLVATLTAAIQEQQAIIESLKARLDAANL